MTYNVFSGTLNPAESINVERMWKSNLPMQLKLWLFRDSALAHCCLQLTRVVTAL